VDRRRKVRFAQRKIDNVPPRCPKLGSSACHGEDGRAAHRIGWTLK
jgi:hypothetical protein